MFGLQKIERYHNKVSQICCQVSRLFFLNPDIRGRSRLPGLYDLLDNEPVV